MTDLSRQELLRQLIAGEAPNADIVERLAAFGWDSERELAALNRADVLAILERYLRGEMTAATIDEWANAVEGREDIGYEPGAEELIGDLVFELANPDISRPLTPESAADWTGRLRAA